jgi:hypothetical protein
MYVYMHTHTCIHKRTYSSKHLMHAGQTNIEFQKYTNACTLHIHKEHLHIYTYTQIRDKILSRWLNLRPVLKNAAEKGVVPSEKLRNAMQDLRLGLTDEQVSASRVRMSVCICCVCMYVCVHTYAHTCMYIYIYIHIYIYIYTYIYIYIYIYTCTHMCTRTQTHKGTRARMYVCMCIRTYSMYVCMHACVCVCMYACLYVCIVCMAYVYVWICTKAHVITRF